MTLLHANIDKIFPKKLKKSTMSILKLGINDILALSQKTKLVFETINLLKISKINFPVVNKINLATINKKILNDSKKLFPNMIHSYSS